MSKLARLRWLSQLLFLYPMWFFMSRVSVDAQTASGPSFEVASVKPSPKSSEPGPNWSAMGAEVEEQVRFKGGPGSSSPERINYSRVTLSMLVKRAYDVKGGQQILGPSWLNNERYDIVANLRSGASDAECRLMLRTLLAERFEVVLHREKRRVGAYSLEVAKGGHKLGPPDKVSDLTRQDFTNRGSEILAAMRAEQATKKAAGEPLIPWESFYLPHATLQEFAEKLSTKMDLPVKDGTGLKGSYAFSLNWFKPRAGTGDNVSAPTIFEALQQQLGLKLRRKEDDIDVLVIDSARRVPTEN